MTQIAKVHIGGGEHIYKATDNPDGLNQACPPKTVVSTREAGGRDHAHREAIRLNQESRNKPTSTKPQYGHSGGTPWYF